MSTESDRQMQTHTHICTHTHTHTRTHTHTQTHAHAHVHASRRKDRWNKPYTQFALECTCTGKNTAKGIRSHMVSFWID